MLSRRFRLKKADFDIAYKKGKQLRHPLLSCRYYLRQENENGMALRIAFVVPRKLAKAAERNRWRRRLRHWFYEILQESAREDAAKEHKCDFIFILTAQGIKAPPMEISRAMRILWQRANRFHGHSEHALH